jgi:hypothetical protein
VAILSWEGVIFAILSCAWEMRACCRSLASRAWAICPSVCFPRAVSWAAVSVKILGLGFGSVLTIVGFGAGDLGGGFFCVVDGLGSWIFLAGAVVVLGTGFGGAGGEGVEVTFFGCETTSDGGAFWVIGADFGALVAAIRGEVGLLAGVCKDIVCTVRRLISERRIGLGRV